MSEPCTALGLCELLCHHFTVAPCFEIDSCRFFSCFVWSRAVKSHYGPFSMFFLCGNLPQDESQASSMPCPCECEGKAPVLLMIVSLSSPLNSAFHGAEGWDGLLILLVLLKEG